MIAFRQVVRLAVLMAASLVASHSFAQSSPPQEIGPRWACWYESVNLTVRCLLGRAPSGDPETRARQVAETIDRHLPPLVRTIWANPEQLAGQLIRIPLWNSPYDMDFVRELADSVMCGRRTDCSANFDANVDGLAPLRALTAAFGTSEAAVMAEAVPAPPVRTSRRRRSALAE